MRNPILSIVIANYNYGRFLECAIQSVIAQNLMDCIELIVCDAGSTDNSLDVIKRYDKYITWWCSEKDGGQSCAFNKGFAHSKGTWITWLNADDIYTPGALKAFVSCAESSSDARWITANAIHFDDNTKLIKIVNWGPHITPPILMGKRAFSAVFGPSSFWRREIYDKVGPIDETLHFAMDTEYWARMTMAGLKQVRLNYICWAFRDHEQSKTEGVQSAVTILKRSEETTYWRGKTGYSYVARISNPWYVVWCIWRVLDGSWLKRYKMKKLLEGKDINAVKEWGNA